MPMEPWISEEPRTTAVARRALARARRRPLLVLFLAAALTGAVMTVRLLESPTYEATLFFRLVEADFADPDHAPRPPRDIRQHISDVALSRRRLEAIMRNHHVSEAWLERDAFAAVEAFREDVSVAVVRNYFIYPRGARGEPRSAQVTLSLTGADAERTRAMLREMGDAILLDQRAQRSELLTDVRAVIDARLAEARSRTRVLQEAMEGLRLRAARARANEAVALEATLAALRVETESALERVAALEQRAAAVAFSSDAEVKRLGLKLELYDESLLTYASPLTAAQIALRTSIVFVVALLLAASVVGVFDDRIYALEDLSWWGLTSFGALTRFPGDDTPVPVRTRP